MLSKRLTPIHHIEKNKERPNKCRTTLFTSDPNSIRLKYSQRKVNVYQEYQKKKKKKEIK